MQADEEETVSDKGGKMASIKIAVLVGSLRQESFSRKVAKELVALAPASLALEILEIGQLPLYNQDFDDMGKPPEEWTAFRQQLQGFEGVLFVTPEYNRSVSGVLKNAIDVGSRPYGKNIWDGKPGAVVSVSPGGIGGFGANHHLRQVLVFVNVPCLHQPEAYIGHADKLFDPQGRLINEKTREFLQKFMEMYANWVERQSVK